jgi:hypothetical protein
VRAREPFDHPDFLFELKHDEWRAMAYVECDQCELVSRRGNAFKSFAPLRAALAAIGREVILDGEVVCLDGAVKRNSTSSSVTAASQSSTLSMFSGWVARIYEVIRPLSARQSWRTWCAVNRGFCTRATLKRAASTCSGSFASRTWRASYANIRARRTVPRVSHG